MSATSAKGQKKKGQIDRAAKRSSASPTKKDVDEAIDDVKADADDAAARKSGETPAAAAAIGETAESTPWVPTWRKATVWQRATYRWVAVTVVMATLLILYTQHPYYRNQQVAPFRTIYPPAFFVWLCVGLFYVKATLEKFSAFRYTMRDSGLHLLMLGRAFQQKRFWRIAKNRRVKTTILGIIVKGFFTPLMVGFFTGHLNSISRAWLNFKHLPSMDFKVPHGANIFTSVSLWWQNVGVRLGDFVPSLHDLSALVQPWLWSRQDFSWGLGLAYDMIFAVDCGWALFGYATESRWLGNKTRSVEPTAFGWVVCLACYPPYNNVLGTYLPLENGPHVFTSDNVLLTFRALTVGLFAIYASATVAFGFRFSNLTNRGIVSRGPYRLVRHPAYLCKCSAWWLEHLPTITITKAFFLSCLCGVYALRAWTEERHLSMDPDYRAYKKKVPWVLIPGVY
jgi:protein-S-isoprenylcysteine O-methyltransferase Ste14